MIKIFPEEFSKEGFLEFLSKNSVNDKIITKFVKLPEKVIRSGDVFDLYINSTRYDTNDPHYEYELNYYSNENIEYLFSLKVFRDVEVSINNLTCELLNGNYIQKTS